MDPQKGCVQPIPSGARLEVKVRPAGRTNAIGGVHDGRLKVEVTVAPEKGKANQAVLRLLAKALGIGKRKLSLTRGVTASAKTIEICGVSPDEVMARLGINGKDEYE